MKRWCLCLYTSFTLCGSVHAQADIQAMLKQIGLLEVYVVDLEKGYKIARDGLTTIGEIKKGEFDLHSIFFSSLESVNPSIVKDSKIAEIISYQVAIVSSFKSLIQRLNGSARLSDGDISYINSVYDNISNECSESLNDLITVTTDGKLEMTDEERIKRIDGIWADMKNKYAFTISFANKASSLDNSMSTESNELEFFKAIE
jgi:hypothetical protein